MHHWKQALSASISNFPLISLCHFENCAPYWRQTRQRKDTEMALMCNSYFIIPFEVHLLRNGAFSFILLSVLSSPLPSCILSSVLIFLVRKKRVLDGFDVRVTPFFRLSPHICVCRAIVHLWWITFQGHYACNHCNLTEKRLSLLPSFCLKGMPRGEKWPPWKKSLKWFLFRNICSYEGAFIVASCFTCLW